MSNKIKILVEINILIIQKQKDKLENFLEKMPNYFYLQEKIKSLWLSTQKQDIKYILGY